MFDTKLFFLNQRDLIQNITTATMIAKGIVHSRPECGRINELLNGSVLSLLTPLCETSLRKDKRSGTHKGEVVSAYVSGSVISEITEQIKFTFGASSLYYRDYGYMPYSRTNTQAYLPYRYLLNSSTTCHAGRYIGSANVP